MKKRITLLLILAALPLDANQTPYTLKNTEDPSSAGAINSNFDSVETDVRTLEKRVLLSRSDCNIDMPDILGQFCFDTTDLSMYVATQIAANGYEKLIAGSDFFASTSSLESRVTTLEASTAALAVATAALDARVIVLEAGGAFLDTTGSTQTKQGGLILGGAIKASSETIGLPGFQVTLATNALVQNTRACSSGFRRVGIDECLDSDGDYIIVVDSIPLLNSGSQFTTYTVPYVSTNGACAVTLSVYNLVSSIANGVNSLYSKSTGSNISFANALLRSRQGNDAGVTSKYDVNEFKLPVNEYGQVDLLCRSSAGAPNNECLVLLVGYQECQR